MRRLIALGTVTLVGCASPGAPPGGPERHTPPEIVTITPDSGSTRVRPSAVVFSFDEVVTDQPGGASGGNLDRLFLISPSDGAPRVHWHGDRIDVSPRRGFQPNTAYNITLLPGLTDRRSNVMTTPETIIFSTGDSIPRFGILGRLFDWAAERPAAGAFVEAIRRPDSTVFLAYTDSTGQYSIGPLDTGTYTLVGIIDKNNNRQVDRLESWDSAHVVIRDVRPAIELLAIPRDTASPRISNVRVEDSLTVRVTFDQYLDPEMPFRTSAVHIQRADSTPVRITAVLRETQFDSLRAAERARQDSLRKDSTSRAAAGGGAATPPPPSAPPPPQATGRGGVAAPPPPKPSRPPPPRGMVVQIDPSMPLVIGRSYKITVDSVRNIVGHTATSDTRFVVPKPAAPDTLHRAPGDTTRRPAGDSTRKPAFTGRRQ